MEIKSMSESILEYSSPYRTQVEEFKIKAISESNESMEKLSLDNLNGVLFMHFKDNILISVMAVEDSKIYTGESDSCRMCRYHILKEYRHSNSGFKMLPYQVEWAKKNKYKVIYWTHDINNRALNAMYQHKRRMPNKQDYFNDPLYRSFKLIPDVVFKVSKHSPMLQYIYAKVLVNDYTWNPTENIVHIKHTELK